MPVTSVTESQTVDAAGNLTDVYELTFTIEGNPGSFTATVPKQGDPVEAARQAIQATTDQVSGIRSL